MSPDKKPEIIANPPYGTGEVVRTVDDLKALNITDELLNKFMQEYQLGYILPRKELKKVHISFRGRYWGKPVSPADGWPLVQVK